MSCIVLFKISSAWRKDAQRVTRSQHLHCETTYHLWLVERDHVPGLLHLHKCEACSSLHAARQSTLYHPVLEWCLVKISLHNGNIHYYRGVVIGEREQANQTGHNMYL